MPKEQRPKKLYHAGGIEESTLSSLIERGWDPIDVRLLPNETDEDRRLALKARLEGIRYGTIDMDPKLSKWMELEAKVYEIHKGVADRPKDQETDEQVRASLDYVLDFGASRQFATTLDEFEKAKTKKKRQHGPRPDTE